MANRLRPPMPPRVILVAVGLAAWALLSGRARGLDPAKAITQYVQNAWQTPEGLPQGSVFSIAQTLDGYIWLATAEGLVRFDGIRFTVFDRSNTSEIHGNYVGALLAGRDGSLWIGTDGGLTRFHGNWVSYTTRNGLVSNHVTSLLEDSKGNIWIGSSEPGVTRLQDGQLKSYSVGDGAPNGPVVMMCEDREGGIWFASNGGGVARFSDGKFVIRTRKDGLPDDRVWSIYADHQGSLWIGTRAGGLTEFKGGKFVTEPIGAGNPNLIASAILEDRDGSLWVGTSRDGIRRRKGDHWEAYRTSNGLSDEFVQSLLEDREGNLWIGTWNGGVNRLANGKFTTIGKQEGLSDNRVISVFEDREGSLWIGTWGGGLNRLADGKVTLFKTESGLPTNSVTSIWEDPQGDLWLGGFKGVGRLKEGRFTVSGAEKGFPTDVGAISGDRFGNIWIGSPHSGLYQFKDGRVTPYSKRNGLTSNYINCVLEDREGNIWVGTNGEGLNRFEKGGFAAFPKESLLSHSLIEGLYEDHDGTIWIGTFGEGLGRLKGGRLTVYTKKDGLFDDSAFQILEDDQGWLWMGCDRGISRVRRSDFDDFDAGKIRSIPHVAYGRSDGLRSVECNGAGQPPGWKGKDGRLWFATQGGVVVVDPARLARNSVPPPVLIEEVLANDQPVDRRQETRLSSDSRRLEIHYTALSFVGPSQVKFRYRLTGLDKTWVDAGARRVAYYTNLPPGKHQFQVIACNNDGVWNDKGASLTFEVLPKFYETRWFFPLLAAVLIGAAWGLHRLHVRQVKARFGAVLAERSRLAREIHDTLAQGFANISIHLESVAEVLEGEQPVARRHLDQARRFARGSLAEARRSVSDLRSGRLQEGDVAQALRDVVEQLTAGTDIVATVVARGRVRRLSGSVEHNLLRIGQEALTNAVKHSSGRTITVELALDQDHARLSVKDDGCGFDADRVSAERDGHFGLFGMRERAEQLDGELLIKSAAGEGTEVVAILPLA